MRFPVTPNGSPLDQAAKKLLAPSEEFDRRWKAREEQLRMEFDEEKRFAEVGRTVMRALRQKGVLMNHRPEPGVAEVCAKYAKMGKDFDTLMDAIRHDVMLQSEWDRMCMMLKLAHNDDEEDNG